MAVPHWLRLREIFTDVLGGISDADIITLAGAVRDCQASLRRLADIAVGGYAAADRKLRDEL